MADLDTLRELLERLTGPDQSADEALMVIEAPGLAEILPYWTRVQRADLVTHYTASVDEAIALVERLDGAYCWRVEKQPPSGIAAFGAPFWATCGRAGEQEQAVGATAAIALCLALVRALSAHP